MEGYVYVQNIIQYSNHVSFTAFFFSLLAVSSRAPCANIKGVYQVILHYAHLPWIQI
jgi:hypothetical protein